MIKNILFTKNPQFFTKTIRIKRGFFHFHKTPNFLKKTFVER